MSWKKQDIPSTVTLWPTWKTLGQPDPAKKGGDGGTLPMTSAEWRQAQDKAQFGVCPACNGAMPPPEVCSEPWTVEVHHPARWRRPEERFTIRACSRECIYAWIDIDLGRRRMSRGSARIYEHKPPRERQRAAG